MKSARLKIIRLPDTSVSVIAWDGQTVASSVTAGLIADALNSSSKRLYFLSYLEEATRPNATDHTVHSGNGPNLIAVAGFCFLDHDYFEEKKAVLLQDELMKIIAWIEELEARGFPGADLDEPDYVFSYIADGPTAEAEFRLASGFRGSTAWS
jgi:hypothetical protein